MKSDTHPEIDKLLVERFKQLSGEERVEMATSMFDTARLIVISSIKDKNPDISDLEMDRELLFRFYGSELSSDRIEKIFNTLK